MTREQTLEAALRKAQQVLREDAAVLGPCDHSVGLCVCDITKTVDDIDAALATPPTSEWDEAITEERIRALKRKEKS